ncbi:DUF1542 domain-containing protein [Lactobacillus sp. ESL0225]|uniref:DUF1542 domain-containing protein n=1 Tax=Lactobacillus sp. ESL0225 TaxID=2069351 RepID=UPI000EFAF22C|nr:DUF1542 domain-containing protein [Lactobacillus sp. ESL0225]RMC51245.1 DUF1542 domain-containing protein [Lactobacillus sp. ESL0225]
MSKNSFYKKMIISVAGAALLSVGVTESTTATNNVSAATVKSAKKVVAKTKVVGATSAVYKKAGKKVVKTKQTISAGKKVKTYGKKTIAGVAYYSIGKDQYVKAANLDGKTRQLAKSVALYARSGKVIKNSKLRKGQSVKVYGTAVTIKGKKYYSTGKGYVAVKALAKKVAEEVPNNKTNMPATDTNKPADNNKPAENTNNPSSNNTNTNNSGSSSNTGTGNTNNPVDTMKDAKAVATKAIDDAATATKTRIDKNASLTDAQKAAANKAVDAVASQAKAAINNAKTIEEIAKAQKDGVANVNAKDTTKPGDSLEDQKLMAVGVLEDAANEARLKIVSSNLSAADKAKAIDAVNKVLSEGKTAIEQGNTVDEVLQMKAQTVAKIKQQVPADTLKEAKAAAASVLDDAANEARVQITSSSLSKDDKAKAIDAVNKALSEGKVAVEQGNTVDEVLQIKTKAVNEIRKQVPADTLKEAKTAAASVLDDAANEARLKITSSSLSKDDKAKAIDAVNKALSEGKVAVEQGNTVEEVLQIKAQTVAKIKQQVPADTLKAAKASAASVLEDAANEARAQIMASKLSDTDKSEAINAVNKALSEGKVAIKQGETVEEVLQMKAKAVSEIRKQVPADTLKEAKAAAVNVLEDAANEARAQIMTSKLSDTDKSKAIDAVNKALSEGKTAIEQGNTVEEVLQIKAQTVAKIKQQVPVDPLNNTRNAAINAIEDAAIAANAQIDNSTLPSADKTKAKTHISNAVTAAKKIINDEQTKSADIVKITNSWISTIKQFVPTDTLKDAKLLAAKAIDDVVKEAKNNISKSILSNEDKAKMQAHVDNIATDAKKAINDATSLEMIAKTQSDWTNNINTAAPKNIKWQGLDLTLINGVLKIKGSTTTIKDPATILSALNTANIDPDEVTSISIEGNLKLSGKVDELFSSLHKLQKIDGLSLLDISEATSIQSMFYGCKDLKELDLSSFNTNKVTDMHSMFKKCFNLSKITFGKDFSTKLVTDMHGMFGDCSVLTGLDLNGFDTSNVTDMREMFAGDKQLTKLDLSKFNTDKVTDMYDMFYCCSGLTDLDLSNFNISLSTNTEDLFNGDIALSNIKISGKLLDLLRNLIKDNGLDVNKLHLEVLPIMSSNK